MFRQASRRSAVPVLGLYQPGKVQLGGITSVGEYAFDQCDALTDVYFGGTQEAWDMVSVGFCNDALTGAVLHYGKVSR
ncbi:MAG: hypothetical protein ACLTXT_01745 [Ruminococcus callidus]